MKKLVLSLGLLAGVAGVAQAQTVGAGIKAGLGLSNVTGSDVGLSTKYRLGFQAGLMAEVGGEHFAFHPELLYSQKGAKYTDSDSYTAGNSTYTASVDGKVRISYLDIPLLLRAKAAGAFFEVGPQLGVLLSQQNDYTTVTTITNPGGSTSSSRTDSENSTNGTRKLDVGYVLGLGYRLPQGLELGLRYNGGFTSLDDDKSSPSKVYNSVFQVQLGYLFGSK